MLLRGVEEAVSLPPDLRPAVLEGEWLGAGGKGALAAATPASVLEGGQEALDELPKWLARHATQFPAGAAIGFFSYELARYFESLPLTTDDSLPDLSLAYYPSMESFPRAKTLPRPRQEEEGRDIQANFDLTNYHRAVRKIRNDIAAGEIYQANLTQQFVVHLNGESPQEIYRRLAPAGAAFSAFLASPERTIISQSPERFFRVANGRVLASPIKGTIARGKTAEEDETQIARLLSSAKDRAENVMIVDLLRNDLGRICHYGSLRARLWDVISLPHLHHLVSHVEGALQPGVGPLEILRAIFPCGSITGAPKIRAMEILAEIERVPRGVSMGSIGIIRGTPDFSQFEMDFNVAIRTMTIEGNIARFNVGGGIVYDSDAEREYDEVLLKAQPLLEALGATGTPVALAGACREMSP